MRKVSGIVLVVMMALLLAACGSDNKKAEPTEASSTGGGNTTVQPTLPAETPVSQIATEATATIGGGLTFASPAAATPASPTGMVASPAASPVMGVPVMQGSPVMAASPAAAFSPAMNGGTPMAAASPVTSTPAAIAVMKPSSDASPAASPQATAAASVTLKGRVELDGAENSAWIISDKGCVGLGSNADLGVGRQVVVRDGSGVIIGVTTLEASDETDACAWTFSLDVPESDYYAVSIPMKTELVFSHDQIAKSGGEITIILR